MKNIITFGDLILDKYIFCNPKKINSEFPNIVFEEKNIKYQLGGVGNVSSSLSLLNYNVYILGTIGNDNISSITKDLLNKNRIDLTYLLDNDGSISLKTRYLSNNNQVFRIDSDYIQLLSDVLETNILKNFDNIVKNHKIDCMVISDYNKGIVSSELTKKIINKCNNCKIPVFVDSKLNNFDKYCNVKLLKSNRNEFNELSKFYNIKNTINEVNLKHICKIMNLEYLLITLDKDGMILFDNNKDKLYSYKNNHVNNVVDVTGAGDIVLSVLVYFYLKDENMDKIVEKANIIGSYSVTFSGCLVLNRNLIESFFHEYKILSIDNVDLIDKFNKKIVFTNGCFDILHNGHLEYLEKSKKLGDILVIGLNSDNSVKRLKGYKRPINSEFDRAKMLLGLKCVDYVIIFDDDTPYNLINKLKPNILVKGGDYKIEEIVGKELVDEVIIMDYKNGYSTSNIVNKISLNN